MENKSMRNLLRTLAIAAASATGVAYGADGSAQYPSKTVRVVVPQAPGGGIDFMARQYAQRLSDSLAQLFVVVKRLVYG
jgi:tripartite-type tricarboxylate transporter receptor subunit TctC